MDDYDEIAEAMSEAAGRDVWFDRDRYAYMTRDGEYEIVVGYADEDVTETVDNLLRM